MTNSNLTLFLAPPAVDWAGKDSTVCGQLFGPAKVAQESAGRAYHSAFPNTTRVKGNDGGERRERTLSTLEQAELAEEIWRKKLLDKNMDLEDFYALMGMPSANVQATPKEIHAAYKKVSIICHPDKASLEDRKFAEDRFKAIQLAYATLTDSYRKVCFDSSLPFDDDLPSASAGTSVKTFFSTYAPVFQRNSRFSVDQPVPPLGSPSDDFDTVNAFYDFWFSFKSWRDYGFLDEHKTENASDREEKRWMQKENAKARSVAKKAEMARIRKLVEDGMKKDPRILKFKRQEEKRKLEAKQLKNKEKREKAEEAARLEKEAEEEAAAAKAEKDAVREAKRNLKRKLKRQRKDVDQAVTRAGFEYPDIEEVCATLDDAQFEELSNAFGEDEAKGTDQFMALVAKLRAFDGDKLKAAKDALGPVKAARAEQKKKAKAAAAAATAAASLAAVKSVDEANSNSKTWTGLQLEQLEFALKSVPSNLNEKKRWNAISKLVTGMNKTDCITRHKFNLANPKKLMAPKAKTPAQLEAVKQAKAKKAEAAKAEEAERQKQKEADKAALAEKREKARKKKERKKANKAKAAAEKAAAQALADEASQKQEQAAAAAKAKAVASADKEVLDAASAETAKRVKKLHKLVKACEKLAAKQAKGETLDEAQATKLAQLGDYQAELDELNA